jgi:hypothetical protein
MYQDLLIAFSATQKSTPNCPVRDPFYIRSGMPGEFLQGFCAGVETPAYLRGYSFPRASPWAILAASRREAQRTGDWGA